MKHCLICVFVSSFVCFFRSHNGGGAFRDYFAIVQDPKLFVAISEDSRKLRLNSQKDSHPLNFHENCLQYQMGAKCNTTESTSKKMALNCYRDTPFLEFHNTPIVGAPTGGCFHEGLVFKNSISCFSWLAWFSWFPRNPGIYCRNCFQLPSSSGFRIIVASTSVKNVPLAL